VELSPGGEHLQVLQRGLAEHPGVELQMVQVAVSHQPTTEVRAVCIDHGEVSEALVAHCRWIDAIGV
jgi:hypothetical protein